MYVSNRGNGLITILGNLAIIWPSSGHMHTSRHKQSVCNLNLHRIHVTLLSSFIYTYTSERNYEVAAARIVTAPACVTSVGCCVTLVLYNYNDKITLSNNMAFNVSFYTTVSSVLILGIWSDVLWCLVDKYSNIQCYKIIIDGFSIDHLFIRFKPF